jgi:hypothetical protein
MPRTSRIDHQASRKWRKAAFAAGAFVLGILAAGTAYATGTFDDGTTLQA